MSSNYSAGQFNDAFAPKRLGNWEVTNIDYEQRPRLGYSGVPTGFIANSRGHLLPNVPRNQRKSPWGCLKNYTANGYFTTRLYKNPSDLKTSLKSKRYPIPRFFKKKIAQENIQRPPAARKLIDTYLNYLRQIQLPVIWIVGLPTKSILKFHKNFAQQLAKELNYFCIELDEQIVKWLNRQIEFPQARKGILKVLNEASNPKKKTVRISNATPKKDKQNSAEMPTRKEDSEDDSGPKIKFDTSAPLDTDKLIELIKFAMIESLPANGFVIDGFPCNMEEAGEFEKQFYPSAVALYLTSTANSQDGPVEKGNVPRKKTAAVDPIVKPKHFTRTYPYVVKDIRHMGNVYGDKLIRVIDVDEFDKNKDMVNYVYHFVKIKLHQYTDRLAGRTPISDGLTSSAMTSCWSETTLTSSQSESDQSSIVTTEPSVVNLPPPLITCSSSSMSSAYPYGNRAESVKIIQTPRPISCDSWNEYGTRRDDDQLESIRSWIPSGATDLEEDEDSPESTNWNNPDDRPIVPMPASVRFSMEELDIFSIPTDFGAFGDRQQIKDDANLEDDPHVHDWFDSTMSQMERNTAFKIDQDDFENDEVEQCDGDHGDALNPKPEGEDKDDEGEI